MKKLLSFLLSSIILMGSSVVTLADTIDNDINNNSPTNVTPKLSIPKSSLTSSGNNISVHITSADLNYTVPNDALISTWDSSSLKRTISVDGKKITKAQEFQVQFVNNSENAQKVKLEFSNIISTDSSTSEQNIIDVTGTGISKGNYENQVQSYTVNLPIDIDNRTTTITILLDLTKINFNKLLTSQKISKMQSDGSIDENLFTLTISLVPETGS